jgi:O-antigen biosynthesis protein WbqP
MIIKRFLDIFLSISILLFLSWLMLIIYLILLITTKGSPIYFSKRIGFNSKTFLMPKFRTMVASAPQIAKAKINKKYITNFGTFLRKYSIDEFPQFFSVISGDMSLVGPRPALFNQNDLIKFRKKYNLDKIKPGITGWAQINGRDLISIKKKICLDKYYYENMTICLDLKIIIKTFFLVIKSRNIKH